MTHPKKVGFLLHQIQTNSNCENIANKNIAKTNKNNKEDKNKRIGK